MPKNLGDTNRPRSTARKRISLFFDKEGRWFHEGVEITHSRTVCLFSQRITREADGSCSITIGDERAPVLVEDTLYVVRSVTIQREVTGKPRDYVLHLNDGQDEFLDATTLTVGGDNVLYCRVKKGTEKARFLRSAYYQLCSCMEGDEQSESFWLPWHGHRVPLGSP